MNIHPSAVVHPEAVVAGDVQIGPYAVIEKGAKIAQGCVIQAHAIITGNVSVGAGTLIGYGAVIGAAPQDLSWSPAIESGVGIGCRNVIREYCTIHRASGPGKLTRVGDDNYLMVGVHLGHDARIGDHVVIANNCLFAGHVEVNDGVVIGGGSVFHQFMRIGELAMVKGGCRFGKDIPPYLVATGENEVAGLNATGLRRSGLDASARSDIKAAFKLLYRSGLNVSQALDRARAQVWGPQAQRFFDFVAAARRRGICDLLRKGRCDPADPNG